MNKKKAPVIIITSVAIIIIIIIGFQSSFLSRQDLNHNSSEKNIVPQNVTQEINVESNSLPSIIDAKGIH